MLALTTALTMLAGAYLFVGGACGLWLVLVTWDACRAADEPVTPAVVGCWLLLCAACLVAWPWLLVTAHRGLARAGAD